MDQRIAVSRVVAFSGPLGFVLLRGKDSLATTCCIDFASSADTNDGTRKPGLWVEESYL